jgi:hypothetical protein
MRLRLDLGLLTLLASIQRSSGPRVVVGRVAGLDEDDEEDEGINNFELRKHYGDRQALLFRTGRLRSGGERTESEKSGKVCLNDRVRAERVTG